MGRFLFLFLGLAWPALAEQPLNVVLILADDLGWSDTTLYGQTSFYQTPNLERLAKRGLTFTQAYSASPLCSPSRSAIRTVTRLRSSCRPPWGRKPLLRTSL
jgi:hypothetical protein